MTTAIFGATGQLGALVLDRLRKRGVDPGTVIAIGRRPERLTELAEQGFGTAEVNYTDRDGLNNVLVGVNTVLLIAGNEVGQRIAQHQNVIDAARHAGVQHFVYTSTLQAMTTTLVLAPEHKATEEALQASGLTNTVLRNGWYTENHEDDFRRAAQTGIIANSVGDGRISSVTREDLADAAAIVLTTNGHNGKVYELAGDSSWTFADFADSASNVLGKPVRYQPLSSGAEVAGLKEHGVDDNTANFIAHLNKDLRNNLQEDNSKQLSALIGRPTTPLVDTLRQWARG